MYPKNFTINQGCISLSAHDLEYGRHIARLHRRLPSCVRANDNMRKSIHGFPLFLYIGMGLRLAAFLAAGAR